MRRKVVVVGGAEPVTGISLQADVVTWPSPDAAGADIVVVAAAENVADVADFAARRAPAAVVIATDAAWCDELLARTCFPRGRVFAAADVPAAVDAILGDSGVELDVSVRHDGERGRDGFHEARAQIGAGGVVSI